MAGQPLLSGTYLLHTRTLCQASESIEQQGKKFQFSATSPGEIGLAIGTIAFTPDSDGALFGKVKETTTNALGSLMLTTVNGVTTGQPMNLTAGNTRSGKYSLDGNTLQLKLKGQPALKLDSVFGQVDENAIAGTLDGVSASTNPADCSTIVRLDRQ